MSCSHQDGSLYQKTYRPASRAAHTSLAIAHAIHFASERSLLDWGAPRPEAEKEAAEDACCARNLDRIREGRPACWPACSPCVFVLCPAVFVVASLPVPRDAGGCVDISGPPPVKLFPHHFCSIAREKLVVGVSAENGVEKFFSGPDVGDPSREQAATSSWSSITAQRKFSRRICRKCPGVSCTRIPFALFCKRVRARGR